MLTNDELTEIYITRQVNWDMFRPEITVVLGTRNNSSSNPIPSWVSLMPKSPHIWQQMSGCVLNIFSYT